MPTDRRSVFKKRLVTDQKAFSFYKKKSKKRKIKSTPDLATYRKIIVSFYKKIGKKMSENRGGVFLPSFGYFVVLLNPIKKLVTSTYKNDTRSFYMNPHSDSRVSHPAFLSMAYDNSMRYFIMDRAFASPLKKEISNNLINGKKYTNHYGLLLSIFKNKKA